MVVMDALHGDSAAAAVADDLFGGGADLQAFFEHAAPEVNATSGREEGEEELEWLSNKDAFPTVETMAPSAPRRRTKGLPRPQSEVRWGPLQAPAAAAAARRCGHCGTEETPQWRWGPEGPKTLCNACGVRYRSGRLVPEYRPVSSPTFSPELHSNLHTRVVELRRRREEAAGASPGAAGNGEEKGDGKPERLSSKGEFLAVQMMAAAARPRKEGMRRPRTEGMRRPRKAVAWPTVAWSPPSPPRAPAVAGRRPNQGGGAGVAVDGDDGVGGCATGDQGRAAVPADGGFNSAAPVVPAAAPGRPWQQFGTEKTLQWFGGPEGRSTLCDACGVRFSSGSMVPVHPPASILTFFPELRFDWHNRVERPAKFSPVAATGVGEEGTEELEWPSKNDAFLGVKGVPPPPAWARPRTKRIRTPRRRRRGLELSPPRTPPPLRQRGGEAAAVEQERVGDGGAAAVEGRASARGGVGEEPAARAAAPRAPAVSRRQCRHCGTEKSPQWRQGPEGRGTLCNACGVRYRSGGLVPEYRPASSPTFSPGLHSNCHRQVEQLRRRREESAEVSPATAVVAGAGAAAAGDK